MWEDNNSTPRDEDVTSRTPSVFSLLVSKFTTEENKGNCFNGLSYDPYKQYGRIFKYPNTLRQRVVFVYPVFVPDSWLRTASYSNLAFHRVSEKVSFIGLAAAGFRYMGQGLVVTCDECNKSVNISDFTSSPCEAKYHESSCSFIELVDRDAGLMGYNVAWSSAPAITSSPLSQTPFHTQGFNTGQAQTSHEIHTSGQSQRSPTTDPPPSSTSTFIHGAGSKEVENSSNIPGFPSSGSSSGAPVSHDIEDDGPSTLLQPLAHISGCPNQVYRPGISPQVHAEILPQQQQHVARGVAGISQHEASATSAVDSGQTHTRNSRPTTQQQQNQQAANSPGRMTTVTSDDIANHGHQSVYRSSVQEDIVAEAERAANQVVHSPVFIVSQSPCYPKYVTYMKRWESYPTEFNHIHTKEALANAGFFYAGYADCVRCFQCGLGLKSWRNGDVINQEHFRNRPDCQFLQLKLRKSGIDVSQLGARVQPYASQSAEPSHATSNAELGLGESTPRQTEEAKIMMQVLNEPNKTNTEEKTLITQTEEKKPIKPPLQEGMVYCMLRPPSETIASAAVRDTNAVWLLEKEQRYLKQMLTCKVCCKNPVKDLFLPCGELVACGDCCKLLTHCPSCNSKILATVTTYLS
ncbi:hypothetical protein BsWGS_28391 [Bradybaena similaris]